jgi:hypothetical protein
MSDEDCREFVKQDLVWLAKFLMAKFNMDVKRVREFLQEMVTVTI